MTPTRHPQTITTRDQFDATKFEDGVVYLDNGRGGQYENSYMDGCWMWRQQGATSWKEITVNALARYLPMTLVSEPDAEPEAKPATPEVTDEQRAAWVSLVAQLDGFEESKRELALIAPLLPSDLTDPQPVLPTEPGTTIYGGRDQPRTMFRLTFGNGPRHWVDDHGGRHADDEVRDLMGEWEETPPVADRKPVTSEQVIQAMNTAFRAGIPGSSMFADALVDAILAIENGAAQ